jgi:hypothetical protein
MEDEHLFDDERDNTRSILRVGACGLDVCANVESVVLGFARKLVEELRRLQRLADALARALDVSAHEPARAVHADDHFDGAVFAFACEREDRAEFLRLAVQ